MGRCSSSKTPAKRCGQELKRREIATLHCVQDVEAFAKADPYVTNGLVPSYTIRPYMYERGLVHIDAHHTTHVTQGGGALMILAYCKSNLLLHCT